MDENIGLSLESLKDQILVALKRDIPKLKIVDDSSLTSYVHLQITSVQTATQTATFVSVSLGRPVEIIGDDGSNHFTFATTWKTGTLMEGPPMEMRSHVREKVSEAMTALAAAYYKDNP